MTTFLQGVIQATENLESARQEAAIAKLAEVMLPDPLMAARGAIALDNLELRDRFVAEEEVPTSADVGKRSGRASRNPYATAARWKKARRSSRSTIVAPSIFRRFSSGTVSRIR